MALKSVNLKHYLVSKLLFRCKRATQFAERHDRAVNCALNVGDLISDIFFLIPYVIEYFIVHITKKLTFGPRCILVCYRYSGTFTQIDT
jgi:hypothetical protein